MQYPTDKKNLTQLEVIELLTLLKDHSEQEIADHFGMTHQAVNYYKKKYDARSLYVIDRVILQLNKESIEESRNYKKQETCVHPHIFFKCPHCLKILGEKDAEQIIEIMKNHIKEQRLLTSQTI